MKTPSKFTPSLSRTIRARQRREPLSLNPSPHRMGRGQPGAAPSRLGAIVALGLALAMLQSAHAAMLHHWDFNTDGTDSISGSNVTLVGTATISGGALNIPGGGVFVDYGSVNLAATLANNP